MTLRHVCRAGAVGLALTALLATAAPASAAAVPLGTGTAGSVDLVVDEEAVAVEPVAPCQTGGVPSGDSGGVGVSGVVQYGESTSSCTIDPVTGFATVQVDGERFRLEEIDSAGVPRLRITSFTVRCQTTETGSNASFQVTGLSGVDVPEQIPPNYTVTYPGATLVINETVIPDPPDGSLSMNVLHLHVNPSAADPDGGDVTVGSVHCDPSPS